MVPMEKTRMLRQDGAHYWERKVGPTRDGPAGPDVPPTLDGGVPLIVCQSVIRHDKSVIYFLASSYKDIHFRPVVTVPSIRGGHVGVPCHPGHFYFCRCPNFYVTSVPDDILGAISVGKWSKEGQGFFTDNQSVWRNEIPQHRYIQV